MAVPGGGGQVERLLSEHLREVDITPEQFVEACGAGGRLRREVNRQVGGR